MAKKELVDYIRQSLSSGYSSAQIIQNLQQSGYGFKDVQEALNEAQGLSSGTPGSTAGSAQGHLGFFSKTKLILIKPKTFFESVKEESDLIHSFNFYSIWTLIFLLIPIIIFTVIYYNSSLKSNPSFSVVSLFASSSSVVMVAIIYFVLILYSIFFMPFKLSAYYFVALKWVFKIKTSFTQSYKAFVYSLIQVYLFPLIFIMFFLLLGFILGALDLTEKAGVVVLILNVIISLAFYSYYRELGLTLVIRENILLSENAQ